MAKLSAHNRTELVRLERRENPARPAFKGDDTLTRDTFYAVMSDGRILTRQTWTAPGFGAPRADVPTFHESRPLKTGWRVHATVKEWKGAAGAAHHRRGIAIKLAQGYVVTSHVPTVEIPPPAIRGPDGKIQPEI